MRRMASHPPLIAPCAVIASIAYSEQVGLKRHSFPISDDRLYRYASTNPFSRWASGLTIPIPSVLSAVVSVCAPGRELRDSLGQIVLQRGIGAVHRGGPGDQHHIVSLSAGGRKDFRRRGAQPPLGAVAGDRVADLAAGGDAIADGGCRDGGADSASRRRACSTKTRRRPSTTGGGNRQEFRAAFQAGQGGGQAGRLRVPALAGSARHRRSGREPLAPLGAAVGQHPAAADRRQTGAKAVTAFAHEFARLIGAFHDTLRRKTTLLASEPRL